ncbi:C-C motif chemokine 25 [Sciurus carolinensis]|uniref:C-C motif chemokine 25 n=1 Tax=Sciurus carolinensis TaxID=30640 RepID=A0AA41N0P7_SCICA|nr:C-C motif chemokine 25 [Sciurus carolinensis]
MHGFECVGGCVVAGAFQDCCLDYHPHATLALLLRARSYWVQEVSGSCNLPAVIFYFRRAHHLVCGNPRDIRVQKAKRILERRASQRSNYNTRLTVQGFLAGRKKLNTGTARPPLSKLKDLSSSSSSSKRNVSLS